jgi:hypothetical protein
MVKPMMVATTTEAEKVLRWLFVDGGAAPDDGVGVCASGPVRDGRVDEGDVLWVAVEVVLADVAPAAGEMVVEAKPRPLGPMLMVWPSMTMVVGVADGPMLYVVPDMTTWEAPMAKVTPPTAVVVGLEPWMVVDANPTPPGPMLMVCPFTTIVVGVADGPMLYVEPDITTCEAPKPTLTPPTAVLLKAGPIRVVEAKPTPAEPIRIVCPFTMIVVGFAEGPME